MIKKVLYIIATVCILASCKKEDEYVSFIIATEKSPFLDTTAVLRGVILAPGKVNIQDCGFVIQNTNFQNQYTYISLGERTSPGKIEVLIDTLKPGQPYKFYVYAESNGKKYQSLADSAMTQEGGVIPK